MNRPLGVRLTGSEHDVKNQCNELSIMYEMAGYIVTTKPPAPSTRQRYRNNWVAYLHVIDPKNSNYEDGDND